MLTEFDQPKLNTSDKGDSHYGNFQEELYDWQDHLAYSYLTRPDTASILMVSSKPILKWVLKMRSH